jgi:HD domain
MPAVPLDLQSLLARAEQVRRYQHPDYPAGFSDDTTAAHTLRVVDRAARLKLDQAAQRQLERMLWIHDLPEVLTLDTTSVEKESSRELDEAIRQQEQRVAERLLSPADQGLLAQFNMAGELLKGRGGAEATSGLGLVPLAAKIVDITDNNVRFHLFLTRWVGASNLQAHQLPPDLALTYTFRWHGPMRLAIQDLGLEAGSRRLCLDLFDEEIELIRAMWRDYPDRVPAAIQPEL